jgi:hypothetical protein
MNIIYLAVKMLLQIPWGRVQGVDKEDDNLLCPSQ